MQVSAVSVRDNEVSGGATSTDIHIIRMTRQHHHENLALGSLGRVLWQVSHVVLVQDAQHTASKFEDHLYMGILQPACRQLREKLSSDMDVRQCALSYFEFGADCALQCLLASDEQLSSGSGKIANMFSLCQHATSYVAEVLLHVAPEELDQCGAATFSEVAERVSDDHTWGQLQETMTSLQTMVGFVKDRLSAVG